MTPKVKIFVDVFPDSAMGHRSTFRDQIWWKSAIAKLPKGPLDYHAKKLGLCGTRPIPHFAQNGPIAPKIPWTLSPLDMSTYYTEFGPYRLRFAELIRERLIFDPKSNYNIGFERDLTPRGENRRGARRIILGIGEGGDGTRGRTKMKEGIGCKEVGLRVPSPSWNPGYATDKLERPVLDAVHGRGRR